MQTVSVERDLDGDADAVRDAMADVEAFMLAAGFDVVTVEDDAIHLENRVGIATLQLDLRIVDGDGDLEYVQEDGIFREMRTSYHLEPTPNGATITATTDFAVDVSLVGELLDATVIKRQRRKELNAQFDYLERVAAGEPA
ncbi:SRPBCC family protein [Haloarculaceae archaeon H-GB2-1]|nr:SRPBCC family protein [Haloarculaceae archaeon H-GB1-1]MEA5386878.1 SRPBCC family protein [Haloarculaceae archaeon H-GB11]MEA5408356.1 SRPBCC family protein [Haloarculaceae archaeon H-GB2-1]